MEDKEALAYALGITLGLKALLARGDAEMSIVLVDHLTQVLNMRGPTPLERAVQEVAKGE